jgi:hypothetical protein
LEFWRRNPNPKTEEDSEALVSEFSIGGLDPGGKLCDESFILGGTERKVDASRNFLPFILIEVPVHINTDIHTNFILLGKS